MASDLEALIAAGRELSREDRYELAHQMLASVDEPVHDQEAIDASWNAEFRRRIDEIESGAVELVDGEETMRMARELIAQRLASSNE